MNRPLLPMRAQIERDFATGTDKWGQPNTPDWGPVGEVKCFAWTPKTALIADGDKVAASQDLRIMFALGCDVCEHDIVAAITDKAGRKVFDGRLRIDGPVQYKHNHLEASLKRVG